MSTVEDEAENEQEIELPADLHPDLRKPLVTYRGEAVHRLLEQFRKMPADS